MICPDIHLTAGEGVTLAEKNAADDEKKGRKGTQRGVAALVRVIRVVSPSRDINEGVWEEP